jgi:hypothetical protein
MHHHPTTFARIARALAPRADRRWIDAMLAELDAVEPHRRSAWIRGALAIAWSGVRMRLAALPVAIWSGIVFTACALVASIGASHSETEWLVMEDDVFLPFAWASGALLVAFAVLAITWVRNHAQAAVPHDR